MTEAEKPTIFKSTRHNHKLNEKFDPSAPRLGRRESEPHSEEITYLYDVLTENFSNSRTLWDLHHYFILGSSKIDIQYDISFFIGWTFEPALTSYDSTNYNNKIPDLTINILSRSTYMNDLSNIKEYSLKLGIPYYIVFAPYTIPSSAFRPPFLRVFKLDKKARIYMEITLTDVAMIEGKDEIHKEFIVDLGEKLPFNVGIMERKRRLSDGTKLFRMILFDKSNKKRLLAKWEKEKERADKEKERADKEKERADKEKERADKEKERADKEKERADKEKERADNLENLLKKYKEKFGGLN